jgi:hypothetical protein
MSETIPWLNELRKCVMHGAGAVRFPDWDKVGSLTRPIRLYLGQPEGNLASALETEGLENSNRASASGAVLV